MQYFSSTFYDEYTALTEEDIARALTPAPKPRRAGTSDAGLAGQQLEFVLDNGVTLRYTFAADTLHVSDGTREAEAPYGAERLDDAVLFTHMLPGTLSGYGVVFDWASRLATVFEVWFGGYERAKREVWRDVQHGYLAGDGPAPETRPVQSNRIEGLGTHWNDDDGREWLYFFPSVIWSSFLELSDPRSQITLTAPSDYFKLSETKYIYARAEQEFSGGFSLEIIDLFEIRHIGMRLGFALDDSLDYHLYSGRGEITGRCTNLELLTDYGAEVPLSEAHKAAIAKNGKGARVSFRPQLLHPDYTEDEVRKIVETNLRPFNAQTIMTSKNLMDTTDKLTGRSMTLRYDDGPAWEYRFDDAEQLRWRAEGETQWHRDEYRAYEAAKDIFLFSHMCHDFFPLRCLTHAVDVSTALTTCVDATLGNGHKPWEVGHRARFGIMEAEGGPTPPAVARHGFTDDLLGKAYSWTYGAHMQSIHVYSSPKSYSWTIMMDKNTGGCMWSSPCMFIKLREDAYLMSWVEDCCNGNQGTFILNPWIMHDAGYFFGIGGTPEEPDVHNTLLGAFARPLAGYELKRFFE